jgi:hypothetical protein
MPVVGVGLVHNKACCSVGMPAAKISSDTLLGFETTGPCPGLSGWLRVGGVGAVVASLWWWGVVFDLWIVVASI